MGLDASADAPLSILQLRTDEKPLRVQGAKLQADSTDVYNLIPDTISAPAGGYKHTEIVINFGTGK